MFGDVAVNVTPFGVDIEKFKKMPEVLHSGFNIGTVKTLDSKYGIDTIIKAFAIFYRDIPEKEEIHRLDKALSAISKTFPDVFLSVDTFRASVAKMCIVNYGVGSFYVISGGGLV